MAGTYVTTRERTLLGKTLPGAYQATRERTLLGKTFVLRRRMLGDSTDVDMVTGLPCDDPRANCGPDLSLIPAPNLGPSPGAPSPIFSSSPQPSAPPLPSSFFQPVRPIIPPTQQINVPAPVISSPAPPPVVFPSLGPITVTSSSTPATTSWLDQQTVAGVPNKYLALGIVGAVLFVSVASAKRRR